jgi:transcriptional regulator with XRE-family HTH domain
MRKHLSPDARAFVRALPRSVQRDITLRLSALRRRRDLTQDDVARKMRCRRNRYQRIEAAATIATPVERAQLARILGVTESDLGLPVAPLDAGRFARAS